MNKGDLIVFDSKKNFKYIKSLGAGGTGDTHLFLDETTGIQFAIKKYAPKDFRYVDEYYSRFVDEIIILFNITHPNIVRIYNYYLYPELKTGYLQMEYVDRVTIDRFEPLDGGKSWDDIFSEIVSAFEYLEKHHILHRDIRPANILVDNNENVKIIDFGFGKQLHDSESEKNSILLNWPATEMPDEVVLNQEYNECTEIYFLGVLFKHILSNTKAPFHFAHIIEKMTQISPIQRYSSFSEISGDIAAGVISEIGFSDSQKQVYRRFADVLSRHIDYYSEKFSPINNISLTLSKLSELIRSSSLETYIQDNTRLINCFVNSGCTGYTYRSTKDIDVQIVIDFYNLIISLSDQKKKILFDNIYGRLSTIPVQSDDELPF